MIHYIKNGKGTFHFDGKIYPVSAGQSFIIFPGIPAYYKSDFDDPWEYIWFAFSGEEADLCLKYAGIDAANPIHNHQDKHSFERLIHDLMESASQSSVASEVKCAGLLHLILASFMNDVQHTGHDMSVTASNSKQRYVNQAIQYIQYHYANKLTVSSIARHLGVDRSYLTRLFVEQIHESPHEFITEYRIEMAIRLLFNSDLPISQIAAAVGFEDAAYFSKVFRRKRGVSPTSFRDNHSSIKKDFTLQR